MYNFDKSCAVYYSKDLQSYEEASKVFELILQARSAEAGVWQVRFFCLPWSLLGLYWPWSTVQQRPSRWAVVSKSNGAVPGLSYADCWQLSSIWESEWNVGHVRCTFSTEKEMIWNRPARNWLSRREPRSLFNKNLWLLRSLLLRISVFYMVGKWWNREQKGKFKEACA